MVEDWKLEAPPAGTRAALVLRFPEPLDRALLERMIRVQGGDGKELQGAIEVGRGEREWRFTPAQAWQATGHFVRVHGELEDLAGNTPLKPFDVDLTQPAPKPGKLTLEFRPSAK